LGGLAKDHPIKRWFAQRAQDVTEATLRQVLAELQGPLSQAWTDEKLDDRMKLAIIRMLDLLEGRPPYLDFVLLQAAGYLRLGNWARAEALLLHWLALPPLERLRTTPWRRDALGRYVREHFQVFRDVLVRGREKRSATEMFLAGVEAFVTDEQLAKAAGDARSWDDGELTAKLRLRYHYAQAPAFADWWLARHLEGLPLTRFEADLLGRADAPLWVFLGHMPSDAGPREALARRLLERREKEPRLFHLMAADADFLPILRRLDARAATNLLKERRNYFLSAWARDRDVLSLAQLVDMGETNEDLVHALLTSP
jgi:hypothetical protein